MNIRTLNNVMIIHFFIKRLHWISSKELGSRKTCTPLICMHQFKVALSLEPIVEGLIWQGGIMFCSEEGVCFSKGENCLANPSKTFSSTLVGSLEFQSVKH
jgi:hypothetical protein